MSRLLLKGLLQRPGDDGGAPSRRRRCWRSWRQRLDRAARRRLGRSLAIREVDAGSCNGCELEINALNNAVYDLERFGIRFVASPRHADVLLVTGPVTHNMREALQRTWDCTPEPEMGGGGRRLRRRLRRVRGLADARGRDRRGRGGAAGRTSTSAAARRRPIDLLEGLLALIAG